MLSRIESTGRKVKVTDLYYTDEYANFLAKLKQAEQEELFNFIRRSLVGDREFSVASKFGSTVLRWEEVPLVYIYNACNHDQALSAKILGTLVMDVLIMDSREWLCTKTDIARRIIPINHYWLRAA